MLSFLLQRYKENFYALFPSCRIITIYTCNRLHFRMFYVVCHKTSILFLVNRFLDNHIVTKDLISN